MDESPLLHPMSRGTLARRGKIGFVAGVVAGVLMGLVMQFGTDIMPLLGRILGDPSALRGWLVHLVMSGVFGVVFAMFVSFRLFEELAASVPGSILLGVIHAMVLSFLMIGVALPFVTAILGTVQGSGGEVLAPGAGGLAEATVLGAAHLVYGVVLGGIYGLYHRSLEEPPEGGQEGPRTTGRD